MEQPTQVKTKTISIRVSAEVWKAWKVKKLSKKVEKWILKQK